MARQYPRLRVLLPVPIASCFPVFYVLLKWRPGGFPGVNYFENIQVSIRKMYMVQR